MKTATRNFAKQMLEAKKAILQFNNSPLSYSYTLHLCMPMRERALEKLDVIYRVRYKTGSELEHEFEVVKIN